MLLLSERLIYAYIVRPEPGHNTLKGHSVMEIYVDDPVGITEKWLSQLKNLSGRM